MQLLTSTVKGLHQKILCKEDRKPLMKAAVNIIEQVVVTWLVTCQGETHFHETYYEIEDGRFFDILVYNDNDKTGSIIKDYFTHR